MATTIHQLGTSIADDRIRKQNRMFRILVMVLALLVVGLGALLVFSATTGDDQPAVSAEMDALIDDFLGIAETLDYEALQGMVTEGFRRPFYESDSTGTPWRAVWTIDDFDFLEGETISYEVERLDDPIIHGEGPWFVSLTANWNRPEARIRYEGIYTLVIVDEDGTLKVDDAYWAARPALLEVDS